MGVRRWERMARRKNNGTGSDVNRNSTIQSRQQQWRSMM
jgi:hypothetical protein